MEEDGAMASVDVDNEISVEAAKEVIVEGDDDKFSVIDSRTQTAK